jgi:uncharacterized protein (UPF0332 family)
MTTFPLSVRVNGTELQATSEVHYQKLLALQAFLHGLLTSPVRDHIAEVVLFGSVARGDPEPDSDVDLLIVGTRHLETLQEVGWEVAEGLPAPHSVVGQLLAVVLQSGQIRQNWDTPSAAHGNYRLAVDGAYNAAELCAQAFLLGEAEEMPSRHGAIIRLFSDRFLKTGRLPASLGRQLNAALENRNRARYVYETQVTESLAQETLALAESLLAHLRDALYQDLVGQP